jgi:hypothetical protein
MRAISLTLITVFGILLIQCDETERIEPETGTGYFPMAENTEWKYLRELFTAGDHTTVMSSDTTRNFIKGDTTIEGLTYKMVVNEYGILEKVIRKKNGKYYGRHHELYGTFTKEYLFLDDNAEVNAVWRHYKNDNTTLTEYKVTALNSTRTFNDIAYDSVMELEVNYYYKDNDEYLLNYSTLHYYAKGIGEIYANYPYPSMAFGDLDISLLKFIP